jgi:hypothetical protein
MPVVPLPWFLPGVALSAVVAVAVSRSLATGLGTSRRLTAGLVLAVGLILAATLTPLEPALAGGAAGSGQCDLSRLTPASPAILLAVDDVSLNVALFAPLGLVLALLPGSRRRRGLLLAGALLLPVVIEGLQLVLPVLDRGCESADVVDNVTGLALGLAIGWAVARVTAWHRARRSGLGPSRRSGLGPSRPAD